MAITGTAGGNRQVRRGVVWVGLRGLEPLTSSLSVGDWWALRSAPAGLYAQSRCMDVRHRAPLCAWIGPQLGPQPSWRDLVKGEAPAR